MKKLITIPILFFLCLNSKSQPIGITSKSPFAPLFEKKGEMTVKASTSPYIIRTDLKVSISDNLAVGVNGGVGSMFLKNIISSSNFDLEWYSGYYGFNAGYFKNYGRFCFDFFSGYEQGGLYAKENTYMSNNDLKSDHKQFNCQADFVLKYIFITRREYWIYYAFGMNAFYDYNKTYIRMKYVPTYNKVFVHYVSEGRGLNFFYRVAAKKLQTEIAVGFRKLKNDNNYRYFSLYSEQTAHFSVGITVNISNLKKSQTENNI